jgi:hypothetical protein
MIARIQRSGTAKRLDASATYTAKGSTVTAFTRCDRSGVGSEYATALDSRDAPRIITRQSMILNNRQAEFLLAVVKSEAATRRPESRS